MGIANTLYKRRFTESKTIAQDLLVETTWADLFMKTQNKELIPGQLYRITDFTTIVKDNYSIDYDGTNHISVTSAEKRFDVVVLALTNDTLSEEASVLPNKTNNPFTGCSLEAWSLKYSFFNESNRFAWAAAPQYNSNATVLVDGVNIVADDVATVVFTANSDVHTLHVLRTNTTDKDAYSVIATADGDYYTLQGVNEVEEYYTKVPYPKAGDTVYTQSQMGMRPLYTIKTISWALSPQGKGVIYRMIDECNNDVCYDFKNILFSGTIEHTQAYSNSNIILDSAYTFFDEHDGVDVSLIGAAFSNKIETTNPFFLPIIVLVADGNSVSGNKIKVHTGLEDNGYIVVEEGMYNCVLDNITNVHVKLLGDSTLNNCNNIFLSGYNGKITVSNVGDSTFLDNVVLLDSIQYSVIQNVKHFQQETTAGSNTLKNIVIQNIDGDYETKTQQFPVSTDFVVTEAGSYNLALTVEDAQQSRTRKYTGTYDGLNNAITWGNGFTTIAWEAGVA